MEIDWPRVLARLQREKRVCLKVGEAAEILRLSERSIVNFIEDGTLGALNLAGKSTSGRNCYRIPAAALIAFVRGRSTLAGAEQALESIPPEKSPRKANLPSGHTKTCIGEIGHS